MQAYNLHYVDDAKWIQAAKARAGSIPSHPQVSKITVSAVF
jgi:hypothetical protein